MFVDPRPLHGSGPSWAAPGQGRCLPGFLTVSELEEPRPQEGATPPGRSHAPRKEPRDSGMVAAAGVVNQADEQLILLPGYFTTPGLHPTHPLQASVVGPTGHRNVGTGWAGTTDCER